MKEKQKIKALGFIFAILFLSVFIQACASGTGKKPDHDELRIAFKLDSHLFGPTYGGEHWVPPPYGPIAYSGTYTLEARAYRVDSAGQENALIAEWIPVDSKIVTVSPDKGSQVTITVHSLGETSLLVKIDQGETKTLFLKATAQNKNVNLVEISE